MKLWAVVWTDITINHNNPLLIGIYDSFEKAVSYADGIFDVPPYFTDSTEKVTKEDDDGNALETDIFHLRKYKTGYSWEMCEIMPYTLNGV